MIVGIPGRPVILLAFISLIFGPLSCAIPPAEEAPPEEWNRTFGGPYADGAWSLQVTKEGGYILAGYTAEQGEGADLWLVKTDGLGNLVWSRTFGGSGEDAGYSVMETEDGGYLVTGSTRSFGVGEERLWILKTDGNGSRAWDRVYGGFISSSGDGGSSVAPASGGGYILTGYTKSSGAGRKDLWLLKVDGEGNKLWEKTFGGAEDDAGMSTVQTGDGGFIVAGRTASFGAGGDDIWLLKVGSHGAEEWNTTFGGRKDDAAFQVVAQEDGYALAGRTESGPEDGQEGRRAILIKTDLRGRKKWERTYEGSAAMSLQPTADGGFIMAGRMDSRESGRDALLIKTDSSGREEWTRLVGGRGDDIGTSAVQCSDGGYALAGITGSFGAGAEDAWLVKLSAAAGEGVDGASRNVTGPKRGEGEGSGGQASADGISAGKNLKLENIERIFKQKLQ